MLIDCRDPFIISTGMFVPALGLKFVVNEAGRGTLACFQRDTDQGLSSKAQCYSKLS